MTGWRERGKDRMADSILSLLLLPYVAWATAFVKSKDGVYVVISVCTVIMNIRLIPAIKVFLFPVD